jgi:hypothetical protein
MVPAGARDSGWTHADGRVVKRLSCSGFLVIRLALLMILIFKVDVFVHVTLLVDELFLHDVIDWHPLGLDFVLLFASVAHNEFRAAEINHYLAGLRTVSSRSHST